MMVIIQASTLSSAGYFYEEPFHNKSRKLNPELLNRSFCGYFA